MTNRSHGLWPVHLSAPFHTERQPTGPWLQRHSPDLTDDFSLSRRSRARHSGARRSELKMNRRAEDCPPYLNSFIPRSRVSAGRIVETVCAAANLISLVAPDDCGQSLCTNTRVPGHNHPGWLRVHSRELGLLFSQVMQLVWFCDYVVVG